MIQHWEDAEQFEGEMSRYVVAVKAERGDDGEVWTGILINPNYSEREREIAIQQADELLRRMAELGPERAVVVDGWQTVRPGVWQLWGKPAADEPTLDA